MYISELKLWNFRKYGNAEDFHIAKPDLIIPFTSGLNVLIGENDSGKSAILDAIKLVLKTHAYEWIKVEDSDFHRAATRLRIEIIFDGLKNEEAKNFTEWLGWQGSGDSATPVLRLIFQVERKNGRILPTEVKAGMDDTGYPLNAEAREYLKTTYLKALRDADNELIAKKNSRISQILLGHDLFKTKDGEKHQFEDDFQELNSKIEEWFKNDDKEEGGKSNKDLIKDVIDTFLEKFISGSPSSKLELTPPEIKSILEKISLGIGDKVNLGLGTMNRLYMAAELLHLKKDWDGLKLCLIEELEAHLHPQAQMRVVQALQEEKDVQFILTTHSPNLASKVDIENLIICQGNDVFPLTPDKTGLDKKDYKYLKRFLDVTKSNLFFAKGVIIVEGWSEEILIPVIAKQLGHDLTQHEVSIVNVGSTAYLHFANIFLRKDGKKINIPISVVTDLDIRPKDDGSFDENEEKKKQAGINDDFKELEDTLVKLEIAKQWTLEWCLFKSPSLSELFKDVLGKVHSCTEEFKKDEQGEFKESLQAKLIKKLCDKSLEKVKIANTLAEMMSIKDTTIDLDDEYIKYLIDAIKHACRVSDGN